MKLIPNILNPTLPLLLTWTVLQGEASGETVHHTYLPDNISIACKSVHFWAMPQSGKTGPLKSGFGNICIRIYVLESTSLICNGYSYSIRCHDTDDMM